MENKKTIKRFTDIKENKYNRQGENIISRENETNMIAYQIPNSDDIILGKLPNKQWLVKTRDGIMIYNTNELEGLYVLDILESDLERLTWSA